MHKKYCDYYHYIIKIRLEDKLKFHDFLPWAVHCCMDGDSHSGRSVSIFRRTLLGYYAEVMHANLKENST